MTGKSLSPAWGRRAQHCNKVGQSYLLAFPLRFCGGFLSTHFHPELPGNNDKIHFAVSWFCYKSHSSPLLECPLQCSVWDFQIVCLAYPRSLQKMLRFVCGLQSYSGCFTNPQGHWWGVFIYGVYYKGIGEKNLTKCFYVILNVCQLWNMTFS